MLLLEQGEQYMLHVPLAMFIITHQLLGEGQCFLSLFGKSFLLHFLLLLQRFRKILYSISKAGDV